MLHNIQHPSAITAWDILLLLMHCNDATLLAVSDVGIAAGCCMSNDYGARGKIQR